MGSSRLPVSNVSQRFQGSRLAVLLLPAARALNRSGDLLGFYSSPVPPEVQLAPGGGGGTLAVEGPAAMGRDASGNEDDRSIYVTRFAYQASVLTCFFQVKTSSSFFAFWQQFVVLLLHFLSSFDLLLDAF